MSAKTFFFFEIASVVKNFGLGAAALNFPRFQNHNWPNSRLLLKPFNEKKSSPIVSTYSVKGNSLERKIKHGLKDILFYDNFLMNLIIYKFINWVVDKCELKSKIS